MAYNISEINALDLSFNEQTAVIGLAFVMSLLSSVLLAAFIFGICKHLECCGSLPEVEMPDCEETSCCIFYKYMCMKYFPHCRCCSGCREWRKEVDRMQKELYEYEMEEMRAREEREREILKEK